MQGPDGPHNIAGIIKEWGYSRTAPAAIAGPRGSAYGMPGSGQLDQPGFWLAADEGDGIGLLLAHLQLAPSTGFCGALGLHGKGDRNQPRTNFDVRPLPSDYGNARSPQ